MRKMKLRVMAGFVALLLMLTGMGNVVAVGAEEKVLVVTSEMVDSNGNVTIAGGEWDKIVVDRNVDAKKISFSKVTVKELVVESGSRCVLEVNSGSVAAVSVTAPDFTVLTYDEIVKMLKDGMDASEVAELYRASLVEKNRLDALQPTLVTGADAVIETVNVSGSAVLKLNRGQVAAVKVDGNGSQNMLNVAIKGYQGALTVNQKDGEQQNYNLMNIKLEDSKLTELTVSGDETKRSSCVIDGGKISEIGKVNVAGTANVTMFVKADEVKISEKAENAAVKIYSEVKNVVVEGDNNRLSIAASAKVESAKVEGDNVKVSTSGTIANSEISGTGSVVVEVPAATGQNTSKPSSKPTTTPTPEKPEEDEPAVPSGTQVCDIFTYTVDEVMRLATITGVTDAAREEINAGTITAIHVPAKVDSWQVAAIGTQAFWGLAAEELTLPKGLLIIGEGAFGWMQELTTLTIPASVENIGICPCAMAKSLTEIIVEEGNLFYCTEDGVLFDKSMNTLLQAPAGKAFGTYEIPAAVGWISDNAFMGCNVSDIVIPESVTTIRSGAFSMLVLNDVYIPASVRNMHIDAFRYTMIDNFEIDEDNIAYASLDGVWYSKDMTQLYWLAAMYDAEFEVPDTVTTILSGAFFALDDLERLIIPSSVTSISKNAFYYTTPVLVVEEGSFAESFATKNGFTVEYMAGESTGTATGSALGFGKK